MVVCDNERLGHSSVEYLIVVKHGMNPERCEGSTVATDIIPSEFILPGAPPTARTMLTPIPDGETALYWNLTCKWCGDKESVAKKR